MHEEWCMAQQNMWKPGSVKHALPFQPTWFHVHAMLMQKSKDAVDGSRFTFCIEWGRGGGLAQSLSCTLASGKDLWHFLTKLDGTGALRPSFKIAVDREMYNVYLMSNMIIHSWTMWQEEAKHVLDVQMA
eukprot:606352-Pelagomonas_calceolata.AAC.5